MGVKENSNFMLTLKGIRTNPKLHLHFFSQRQVTYLAYEIALIFFSNLSVDTEFSSADNLIISARFKI